MRRVRCAGAVGVVLAVSCAPPAVAADVASERHVPVAGPVLHGHDGMAWFAGDPRGALELRVWRAGGTSVPLRLRPSRGRRVITGSVASDGDALALGVTETAGLPDAPAVATRLYAGPAAGPLAPFAGPCTTELLSQAAYRVALSGGVLASLGPACGERSLTDLRTRARILALPAAADDLMQEGAIAAWTEREDLAPGTTGRAIVVQDVIAGTRMRVPGSARWLSPYELDVDGRGSAAWLARRRRTGREVLYWTAPGSPQVRARALPRRWYTHALELSDGVAALLQVPAGGPLEAGRVVLAPLAESAPLRPGAAGVSVGNPLDPPLAFDGARLAALVRPCGRVELVAARVGDVALHRRPPRRCPLRLLAPPRVTRTHLVTAIACDGYRWNCQADSLRATTLRGRRTIARDRVDDTPRESALRLTRLGRRLARRGPLRRIRLTAELGDYVDPRLRDRRHSALVDVRPSR